MLKVTKNQPGKIGSGGRRIWIESRNWSTEELTFQLKIYYLPSFSWMYHPPLSLISLWYKFFTWLQDAILSWLFSTSLMLCWSSLFFQTLNVKDSGLNLWLSSLLYPHSLHDLLLSCMTFTSISTPVIPCFPSPAQVSTIFMLIDPNVSPFCPLDV